MEKKQSKWIWKTVVAACIAASILSYMCVPSVKDMMNKIVTMFATGDFGVVREFVASYGNYAAAVSFGLMVLQSVMAPLPAFLITFANANLFGWWQGAILTSKAGLKQIDTFFDKYGKNTILICRLLPFVSFDIVSYGAGLTSMPFLSFFIATGIGQLPATIVYSYVGGMLTGGARFFVTGLLILFALSAFIAMVRKIYIEKQDKTRRKK